MRRSRTSERAAIALIALVSCRSAPVEPAAAPGDTQAVQTTLDALYTAFSFDARGGADWDAIRKLCASGAVFVAPIERKKSPRVVGIDEFLRDFQQYVASEAVRNTGLHERIVHARIDQFGSIAHAYVAFEGFVPGLNAVQQRGLDSIQLVRDGDKWLVVSFTTQYEGKAEPLPDRFLR